jgi:hypothetical protein
MRVDSLTAKPVLSVSQNKYGNTKTMRRLIFKFCKGEKLGGVDRTPLYYSSFVFP